MSSAITNPGKKPKAVFTYCFQVWGTGIFLGPLISLIWAARYFDTRGEWLSYDVYITFYGGLLSLPSLVLFGGGGAVLFPLAWPVQVKRLVLSVYGIGLTMATFGVAFGYPLSIHLEGYPGSFCYIMPSLLGLWIYEWPGRVK